MKTIKVGVDVDGTLIHKDETGRDIPRYDIIVMLGFLCASAADVEVYVWSGGGVDYARMWAEKLGMASNVRVVEKGSVFVDIAIDDEEVQLGQVNLRV